MSLFRGSPCTAGILFKNNHNKMNRGKASIDLIFSLQLRLSPSLLHVANSTFGQHRPFVWSLLIREELPQALESGRPKSSIVT